MGGRCAQALQRTNHCRQGSYGDLSGQSTHSRSWEKISHRLTRMTQIKNRPETFIDFLTFLSVLIRVIRVNLWLSFHTVSARGWYFSVSTQPSRRLTSPGIADKLGLILLRLKAVLCNLRLCG